MCVDEFTQYCFSVEKWSGEDLPRLRYDEQLIIGVTSLPLDALTSAM